MRPNKKSSNSSNNNVILALMFIIVIVLIVYIIFFTGKGKSSNFTEDAVMLQNKISYYLGKTDTEMFGAYTVENIITGKNQDGNEIKSVSEETLKPICDLDTKIESNNVKYYKLNSDNVEEVLNYKVPKYNNVDWYLSQTGDIKVKINGAEPDFWNESYDSMKIK